MSTLALILSIIVNYVSSLKGYQQVIQTGVKSDTKISIDILYSDKLKAVVFPFDQDQRSQISQVDVININIYNNTNTVLSVPYFQDTCLRIYPISYLTKQMPSKDPESINLAILSNINTLGGNVANPCGIVDVSMYVLKVSRDLSYSFVNKVTNIDLLGLNGQRKCPGCDYYKIISMTMYKGKMVGLFMYTSVNDSTKKIFVIAVFNPQNAKPVEQLYIYTYDLTYVKGIDIYPGTSYLYFLYPDIKANKYYLVMLDLDNYYILENPGTFIPLNVNNVPKVKPTDIILDLQHLVFMFANEIGTKFVDGVYFSTIFLYNFNLDTSLTKVLIENTNYLNVRKHLTTEDSISTVLWMNPFFVVCVTNYCQSIKINNFPYLTDSQNLVLWESVFLTNVVNSSVDKTVLTNLVNVSDDDINRKLMFSALVSESGSNFKTIFGYLNFPDSCLFYQSNQGGRCREQCYGSEITSDQNHQCISLDCSSMLMKRSGCVNNCLATDYTLTINGMSYCLDYCPYGYYKYNNKCIKDCPFNTFIDLDNKQCLTSCPISQRVYKNYCVTTCHTGIVDETVNPSQCLDKCVNSYQLKGPVYSTCVLNCPFGYIIDPSGSNQCIQCGPNSICTNICPKYNIVVQLDPVTRNCITCKSINKYYYQGLCLDNIPNVPHQLISEFNAVIDCQSDGLFIYEGNCIAQCPVSYYPYDKTYECKKSDLPGIYITIDGFLSDHCPAGTGIESSNICKDCKTRGLFTYNNLCVLACPFYFYQDRNSFSCVSCSILDMSNPDYINNCISCESGFVLNGQCKRCGPDEFLFNASSCVRTCSYNSRVDWVNRTCEPCFVNNKYLYNNKCVAACPDGLIQNMDTHVCETRGNSCTNFKCNSGQCKMANTNEPYCECTLGYTGLFCESTTGNFNTFTTVSRNSLNNTFIPDDFINEAYYNLTYAQNANPTSVQANIDAIVANIVLLYSNPSTYQNNPNLADNVAGLSDFVTKQLKNPEDKNYFTRQYIEKLGKALDIKAIQQLPKSFLSQSPDVKVTVSDISNYTEYSQSAINNGMSYIDLTPCEDNIRKALHLSPTDPILIKQIQYNVNTTSTDGKVTTRTKVDFFDKNNNNLDISTLCGDLGINVAIPIDQNKFDNETYSAYMIKGVNIYNQDDPFFNFVCYPFTDLNNTLYDVPLSARRKELKDIVDCDGCLFAGINPITSYVTCNCVNATSTGQGVISAIQGGFFYNNLQLFGCWDYVIGEKASFKNIGYYIAIATFVATILSLIISSFIDERCRNRKIKYNAIFRNDGQIYYQELFDLREYLLFLFKLYEQHKKDEKKEQEMNNQEGDKPKDVNEVGTFKSQTDGDDSSHLMTKEKDVIAELDVKKINEGEKDKKALSKMVRLVSQASSRGKNNLTSRSIEKELRPCI
jgi:hypothetical protein